MNKALKTPLFVVITLAAVAILGEIVCRLAGVQPKSDLRTEQLAFSMRPDSFYVNHKLLGWRLGAGRFTHYLNDTIVITHYTNRASGRITAPDSTIINDSLPQIFIMGCSFPYGYSVDDTSNYPYYLQGLLPAYKVYNKGVPGYGLTQMYLALVDEVEHKGHHPQIAVFNYSVMHDMRTPLFYNWSVMVKNGLRVQGNNSKLGEVYPYGYIENDTLVIAHYPWDELVDDFPLRNKSALINLINTAYFNRHDAQQAEYLNKISVLTMHKITAYCRQHNIICVFAGLDKNAQKVFGELPKDEAPSMLFTVDIERDGYNNAPIDKGHPNPKAHRQYARELYEFLLHQQLVKN